MARALIAHGRAPDETAALIYDATLPSQRTVEGTLGTIAELADPQTSRRCSSSARSRGCARTCAGSTIGRSRAGASSSRDRASRRASSSTCSRSAAPKRSPRRDPDHARRRIRRRSRTRAPRPGRSTGSCSRARTPSTTSCSWLLAIGDVRELHGVRLCTVGPSTASRLQRYGIRVDLMPAEFRADAIAEALKASGDLKGQRDPAAARRHRARSARRGAARGGRGSRRRRRLPDDPRRTPIATPTTTSTGCCSIDRSTR